MNVTENVYNLYKRKGETPLAALKRLQKAVVKLQSFPLTYAGRLDPLAEGVLLVLVGEEAKNKDSYLILRKRYRVDVLFGFSTDTHDVAGILTDVKDARVSLPQVTEAVARLTGTYEEPYPAYSSKPVFGKPLFMWARENRLHEIEVPRHTVTVYSSLLRQTRSITGEELGEEIGHSLNVLSGDFRQREIRDLWQQNLKMRQGKLYDVVTIEIECSSGTYMRTIAERLGHMLQIPALALRIVRTRVGNYQLEESLVLNT